MAKLAYSDPNLVSSFQSLKYSVSEVQTAGEQVHSIILRIDNYRLAIIGVGFAVPALILIVGGAGLYFKNRTVFMFFAVLLSLQLCFLWVSLAVHTPAVKVANDACNEADYYLDHPDELVGDEYGSFILSCLKNDTYFGQFNGVFNSLQNEMTSIKNQAAEYNISISDILPPANATIEDTVINLANFVNSQITIVLTGFAGLPYPDNESQPVLDTKAAIGDAQIYLNVALNVSELATCSYLKTILLSLKEQFCTHMTGGSREIVAANWGLIVFSIVVGYLMLSLSNDRGQYQQFQNEQEEPLDSQRPPSNIAYLPLFSVQSQPPSSSSAYLQPSLALPYQPQQQQQPQQYPQPQPNYPPSLQPNYPSLQTNYPTNYPTLPTAVDVPEEEETMR